MKEEVSSRVDIHRLPQMLTRPLLHLHRSALGPHDSVPGESTAQKNPHSFNTRMPPHTRTRADTRTCNTLHSIHKSIHTHPRVERLESEDVTCAQADRWQRHEETSHGRERRQVSLYTVRRRGVFCLFCMLSVQCGSILFSSPSVSYGFSFDTLFSSLEFLGTICLSSLALFETKHLPFIGSYFSEERRKKTTEVSDRKEREERKKKS